MSAIIKLKYIIVFLWSGLFYFSYAGMGISRFVSLPELRSASVGFCIMDIETGEIVSSYDSQRLLLPASALKLLTSATALGIYGGEHRFYTDVQYSGYIGKDGVPRLSVLDVQKQIRSIPKPVIAAVNGFAIGGGHVLHVVCDLSIASENAIFGQTGPRVGSFDAGFGASYLARVVGQKKAREIWFLCRKYNAQEALDMGLVNKVVPLEQLEDEYVQWAEEMMLLSPLALRMIKAGLNAELDGQAGIQELAGDATLLYYLTDEAQEGKNAFLEKRKPNFKQYPKFP